MKRSRLIGFASAVLTLATTVAQAQSSLPFTAPKMDTLTESGHVNSGGHAVSFLIRRLPINAFPGLPVGIANELTDRGCLIPQTFEAHRPENVVHASLEHAGSSDWAVLCSKQGTVSLLIFFGSAPEKPIVLATAPETERLQTHLASDDLGFNWGIDPASPLRIHEAQSGLQKRPPAPDHDALADSIVDQRTVYHFYVRGQWTLLEMPVD
jgi:hypothetical protein